MTRIHAGSRTRSANRSHPAARGHRAPREEVTALGELLIPSSPLAKELRLGTIDRVMEKSDIELGVEYYYGAGAERPDWR